ncbi:MAG: alpha/beta fold hydrolase, partial [Hyphomicrobiaceae bacterium]
MAKITTDDGVALHVEESGSGSPIVFVHEFAGDHRSWEPQMRFFSRRHHCIAYAARGWPPSEIPDDVAMYSQARARDDIRAVLDALKIDKAHIVGLSMGGFATLHFGLTYPDRALSLTVAGCGYGAEKGERDKFRAEAVVSSTLLEEKGMAAFTEAYAHGPTRVQFENKDPRGFAEFKEMLAEHSNIGSARTQMGVQRERPSLYDLEAELRALTVPTLIVSGDEDWPCLEPGIYMKQCIASAGLLIVPNTGHTVNLEEPALFNQGVADFIAQVEAGRWPNRDSRAVSDSIT